MWLIAGLINQRRQTSFYFVVGLNDLTALAPERRATVSTPTSGNIEALAYVTSLDHCVDPTTQEQSEAAMD